MSEAIFELPQDLEINQVKNPVMRGLISLSLKSIKNKTISYNDEYDKYSEYADSMTHWERAPEPLPDDINR